MNGSATPRTPANIDTLFDLTTRSFDPSAPFSARPHLMIEHFGAQLVSGLTINQLVDARPERARFFETLHLNYCCSGGDKSFGGACAERGLDAQGVLDGLLDYDKSLTVSETPPDDSMHATLERIYQSHDWLRRETPRLQCLLAQVVGNHGHLFHELWEIEGAFEELGEQLSLRLHRHETQLFPLCRHLAEQYAGEQHTFGREAHFVQWRLGRQIEASQAERIWMSASLDQINGWAKRLQNDHSVCTRLRVAINGLREFDAQLGGLFHDENLLLSRLTTLDEACRDSAQHFAPSWMQEN